ncbi:hypothetical protein DAPPUDRAFT_97277 [Daphnia pulex]|uniref:AGC-kinase C-terminal domain-containing protein n=1 Tax=Daphnia pulex TaxID=6669 RepID=E9FZG1_DAPPU|nr:hypothetical protein DAPPUDRAFT_97277 [Daphnia pulex]|eukprot:EFX87051.1 hypothetical protein DAPPUDRAFT_97277 [Daphnia pulex]
MPNCIRYLCDSGSADHALVFESDDVNSSSGSSSESARRLIRGLLTVDPPKRVRSLRTLKNHAFYHHFDFEALGSKKVDPFPLLAKQREKRRCIPDETEAAISFD